MRKDKRIILLVVSLCSLYAGVVLLSSGCSHPVYVQKRIHGLVSAYCQLPEVERKLIRSRFATEYGKEPYIIVQCEKLFRMAPPLG